mgnify:CR=1 FL=1
MATPTDELLPNLNTMLDEEIQHSRIQGLTHTKGDEATRSVRNMNFTINTLQNRKNKTQRVKVNYKKQWKA